MNHEFGVRGARGCLALAGVLFLVATGCAPGEDPTIARARVVLLERAAENPEYGRYLLAIAGGSDAPETSAYVVQAIGSDNFQTAIEAVSALGDDPPPEALEPLREVFQGKGGALKRQAAIQLARLGQPDALGFLREQIADPAQTLDVAAVVLVARSAGGEELLTPLLRERTSSEDATVRNEVYAVLGEIREPWSTALLVEGLKNEHGEERQHAIRSLGRTGDPSVAGAIRPFVNTRGLVFASLEALGSLGDPDSVQAVEKMARSDEAAVRVYAAAALWKLDRKSVAVESVNELLQSPDATVRSILAEQLGSIEDQEAWSRLATLAEDESKDVQIEALRAILAGSRPEFEPVLAKATEDDDYEVATLALNGLARTGRHGSIEPLASLLEDENPYVALSAANAILSIHARHPVGSSD